MRTRAVVQIGLIGCVVAALMVIGVVVIRSQEDHYDGPPRGAGELLERMESELAASGKYLFVSQVGEGLVYNDVKVDAYFDFPRDRALLKTTVEIPSMTFSQTDSIGNIRLLPVTPNPSPAGESVSYVVLIGESLYRSIAGVSREPKGQDAKAYRESCLSGISELVAYITCGLYPQAGSAPAGLRAGPRVSVSKFGDHLSYSFSYEWNTVLLVGPPCLGNGDCRTNDREMRRHVRVTFHI